MDLQAFQPWERRNSSDTVTRPGSYSKQTDLVNATNTGVLDYIGNNLDVLNDTQAEISTSDINDLFTGTLADTSNASVVGNRLDNLDDRVSTNTSSINSINSSISTLNSNVSTLSNGKVSKAGDTMSGSLIFTTDIVAKRNINTDAIALISGTEWNNGGMVKAFGKEYNNYLAGGVELSANNGTDSAKIRILPGGTTECPTPATTDNSNKIATTAYVNNACLTRQGITYTGNSTYINGWTNCSYKVGRFLRITGYFNVTKAIPNATELFTISSPTVDFGANQRIIVSKNDGSSNAVLKTSGTKILSDMAINSTGYYIIDTVLLCL